MAGAGSRGRADGGDAEEAGAPAAPGTGSAPPGKVWIGTGDGSEGGCNGPGNGSAPNAFAPWNNVRATRAHRAPAATRDLESRT